MNLSSRELLAVNRAIISIRCKGFELVVRAADSQKLCKSRPYSTGYFGSGVGFCGMVQVFICVYACNGCMLCSGAEGSGNSGAAVQKIAAIAVQLRDDRKRRVVSLVVIVICLKMELFPSCLEGTFSNWSYVRGRITLGQEVPFLYSLLVVTAVVN
ncbi:hypothetical protein F0562_013362 [Nyssa sinensis]|uniref:Uncharacterized protein n=1 Tax=Nyssa sinensis TaxID=561372 RepID=A0A5J4ZN52_9ASTE|nr:hypothetical protein F0562_013362 [Nyssa sinensis]